MEINYDNYINDGWGLSKLGFEKLYELIKNDNKKIINVLEFGSGVSTKFFSDLSKILNKDIYVTSFDNDITYMYKDKSNPKVVVNLRGLEETDDGAFEQMFVVKKYNKLVMKPKTSSHLRNQFYILQPNDISGIYDYMLLDGPHGNGRSMAFLHTIEHLTTDSIIFIDDSTHYDFAGHLLKIFNAEKIFENIAGNKNKWVFGGDFSIYKIKNVL
jgi:hypothetical protein